MSIAAIRNLAAVERAIADYATDHGYPPAYADLCRMTGIKSKATVKAVVDELEHRGRVLREPGIPRSLRLRPPA